MPKTKPGESRKGKNKSRQGTTNADQGDLNAELIQTITRNVLEALSKDKKEEGKSKSPVTKKNDTTSQNSTVSSSSLGNINNTAQEDRGEVVTVSDDDILMSATSSTSSLSTPISAMVDLTLQNKIWQDKYIDLALLLPQNCSPGSKKQGLQFQIGVDSMLSLVQNKPKFQIRDIEQWTSAFMRFIAIYSVKYPDSVPHLIKHAEIVRILANSQVPLNDWIQYDQKVRMDRQIRGVAWDNLNMEFFIMAFRPTNNSFRPFRGRNQFQGGNRQYAQLPKGLCWNFNKDGYCRANPCKFQHKCAHCRGNHSMSKCFKNGGDSKPGPSNQTSKPSEKK